jgi:hypothetical protein
VLRGTVSHEDFQRYLTYVEKHGAREQAIQATLGATGVYSHAYGQEVAKMEAAGIAGTVAAAPVAIAGGTAVAVGAVGGGTTGFVSGLLDKASAKVIAARTATGALFGAAFGWAAQRIRAFVSGEASPSVPGASKTDPVAVKPAAGEPVPAKPTAPGLMDLPEPPTHVRVSQRGDAIYYLDEQGLPVRSAVRGMSRSLLKSGS